MRLQSIPVHILMLQHISEKMLYDNMRYLWRSLLGQGSSLMSRYVVDFILLKVREINTSQAANVIKFKSKDDDPIF